MADDLYDLSDEELEAAFKAAKAEEQSPETELEVGQVEDEVIDESVEDSDEEFDDEIEDSLEHPDAQDSDDDTDTDELDEDEVEEDSDEEDADPDEEADTEDEQTDETAEADDTKVQPTQDEVLKFKANGQDYEFTTAEMKEQFGRVFAQAMDYTKKTQQIKPWRKTIDAMEQAELGQDDVNLMIDVLKGDKEAIAEVLKRTGVDALDLDTENSNYEAKDYGRNDTELSIKDIVDEISVDKEYAVTHNVLEKQWDDRSRQAFVEDPNMIRLLHTDVKTGMFDKVSPIAQKLKVYDGGKQSDLDYYMSAAKQYFANQQAQEATQVAESNRAAELTKLNEVKAKQEKQKAVRQTSVKRKAAAPTRKVAGTKRTGNLLDDSDEAFEEWYSKLQESQ